MLVIWVGARLDMKNRMMVGFAAFVTFYALNITVNTFMTSYKTAVTMTPHPHHTMPLLHTGFQECGASVDLMVNRTATRSARPSLSRTCTGVSAAV